MRRLLYLPLVSMAGLLGCPVPQLACDDEVACPAGQFCDDSGFCELGETPIVDAGRPDAGPPVDDDAGSPVDAGLEDGGFLFPDAGLEDSGPLPQAYALFAVEPPRAQAGQTVTLHGSFPSTIRVAFPGAASFVTASTSSQVHVVVPSTAGSGRLVVTEADATPIGSLAFQDRSYDEQLGIWGFDPEQTHGAQASPRTFDEDAVQDHVLVYTPPWLHSLGGLNTVNEVNLQTHRRARVYADGTTSNPRAAGVELLHGRRFPAAARAGDFVFVVGGEDLAAVPVAEIERFRVVDGDLVEPTVVGILPAPRRSVGLVVAGETLIVIGGRSGDAFFDRVDVAPIGADGSLGSFSAGPILTTPRRGPAVVVAADRLYVIGGGTPVALDSTESVALDDKGAPTGSFTVEASLLPSPYDLGASVRLNSSFCLLGGSPNGSDSRQTLCAPLDEVTGLGVFAPSRQLFDVRLEHAAFVANGRVLALGGRGEDAPFIASDQARLDAGATLGGFVRGPDLNRARGNAKCGVFGDHVYVFGGQVASDPDVGRDVERAPILDDGALGPFEDLGLLLPSSWRDGVVAVADDRAQLVSGSDGTTVYLAAFASPIDELGADVTLGTFTPRLNELLSAHSFASGVFFATRLFIAGGTSLDRVESSGLGGLLDWLDAQQSLTTPRGFSSSVRIDDTFVVLGGGEIGAPVSRVDAFPVVNSQLEVPLGYDDANVARLQSMPVLIGTDLYLLGGLDAATDSLSSAVVVDLSGAPPYPSAIRNNVMPNDLQTFGCALRLGNFVHLIGGSTATAGVFSVTARSYSARVE